MTLKLFPLPQNRDGRGGLSKIPIPAVSILLITDNENKVKKRDTPSAISIILITDKQI